MLWRRGCLGLALLFVGLFVAGPSEAFCGFYVSSADTKLTANASQVVVMREGTRTVLSMQNDYEGPLTSFAMVVPVPVTLQKENVKTLSRELFTRIDELDAPRLVEYWERDPCVSPNDIVTDTKGPGAGALRPKAGRAAAPPDLGVVIEAQFAVGEYEIVILGAKDSAGLDAWLRQAGYKIPDGSEPFLRPYVQAGSKFFVARVDATKVKMENGRATLSPLRFHYDSPDLSVPIRLGLVNSSGTQDLIVHVLGRGKRYEVANYPNVTIPTNLDVSEETKGAFGTFYAALFDRSIAKTPNAVVTEYAWDAGTCDPCPSPPLTDRELVTLGADVLPSVASEAQLVDTGFLKALGGEGGAAPRPNARKYYGLGTSFVLTRLHARYTRESLGSDLQLREAPPLQGGRETRGANGALDSVHLVAEGEENTFQGRYAVRHPWTGPIACEKPVRGEWGGPPNGIDNGRPKLATGLAYAPRGKVQLASFLRSDKGALDVQATGASPSSVRTFSPPGAPSGAPPAAKSASCLGCATSRSGSGGMAMGGGLAFVLATVLRRIRRR